MKDPTVHWGFENVGHKLWSELSDLDLDGVLQDAEKYGIKFGFTFATDTGSSKSITSFARGDREFSEDEIKEICGLAEQLHVETAELTDISSENREYLKKISVDFTHG